MLLLGVGWGGGAGARGAGEGSVHSNSSFVIFSSSADCGWSDDNMALCLRGGPVRSTSIGSGGVGVGAGAVARVRLMRRLKAKSFIPALMTRTFWRAGIYGATFSFLLHRTRHLEHVYTDTDVRSALVTPTPIQKLEILAALQVFL